MPLPESFSHNDVQAKSPAPAAENSPMHLEAWDSLKNFVMNKVVDRTAPTVLIGDAIWGPVNLSATPQHSVEGLLESERAQMHMSGSNQFSGDTPWGATNLKFENGKLSGHGPWGDISLRVDAQSVTGDVPWGKVNLTLKGQQLTGTTPWGQPHFTLGEKYHTLTNPDVLMALSAIMSDR